jgi:hypothetical protein
MDESADWTGLKVTGTYSDKTSAEIIDYEISGFNSSSPGEKTITVAKNGFSDTFTVTVNPSEEVVLVHLSITSFPSKLVYELHASPNWAGLEVRETYSDGSSRIETNYHTYVFSGFNFSILGEQTVTINKGSRIATFIITVKDLTSLFISAEPDKKEYELGESPDWTGLIVIGNYLAKDPQIETIDYNSDISGFDSSSPGIKTITVTKTGVSVSFTVQVLSKSSGAVTILPPLQAEDIALTSEGATVTASGGYTGYQWFVDDMPQPADSGSGGQTITLSALGYASGTYHRVWVIARIQGIPYSGETCITLP